MLILIGATAPEELLFLGKGFTVVLLILFAVWCIGPGPKKE